MSRLPPAPRALNNFDNSSWGSAALHPRLYAVARYRGLRLPGKNLRQLLWRHYFELIVRNSHSASYQFAISEIVRCGESDLPACDRKQLAQSVRAAKAPMTNPCP